MTKEYESSIITPENAEGKIDEFLKGTRVGSVELIAFCNALEWRSTYNHLREYRRVLELMDCGEVVPELYRGVFRTRSEVKSELRVAEMRHALIEHEERKCESAIPGYTSASLYSEELIQRYEEHQIRTKSFGLNDPTLEELRRRGEAFDYINESLHEIKIADQNAGAHWLIGLIQRLK